MKKASKKINLPTMRQLNVMLKERIKRHSEEGERIEFSKKIIGVYGNTKLFKSFINNFFKS